MAGLELGEAEERLVDERIGRGGGAPFTFDELVRALGRLRGKREPELWRKSTHELVETAETLVRQGHLLREIALRIAQT